MNKINEIELFLGMEETDLHDEFYCVLMGQFSSGKSKFLNRLFGNEYLPVGTREMTAVPTYISCGEDSAILYKSTENEIISVSEIKNIKKGKCNCERIEMKLSSLNTPENMVFIDTPGINSVLFENCDKELNKANAVLYFLAKRISAVDVEMIDRICSKKDIKLIVIRTRIDDIKGSEENIYETYSEENDLIMSIYPNAEFFFVSLNSEDCNLNQVSELIRYVRYDLIKELEHKRKTYVETYVEKVLRPALNKVKNEIETSSNELSKDNLFRKTQKQLKLIRKNVNAGEEQIRAHINEAKENYFKSGCTFIKKAIVSKGSISCMEIQTYIMKSTRKLEMWYELEFEDIVADISVSGKSLGTQKLVSDEVISHIFEKYARNRTRFAEFSIVEQECDEKFDQYSDVAKAEAYLKKTLNSIFLRIDDDFSSLYLERIDSIIKELDSRYAREDELIYKYASNKIKSIETINLYLLELNDYGNEQEIA